MRAASRKGLAIAPPISAGMGSQLFLHIFAVGALAAAKGAGIEAGEVEKMLALVEWENAKWTKNLMATKYWKCELRQLWPSQMWQC
jgi:hypothetical protein